VTFRRERCRGALFSIRPTRHSSSTPQAADCRRCGDNWAAIWIVICNDILGWTAGLL